MSTETKARLDRKGLLALAKIADDEGKWLHFRAHERDHYISPDDLRNMAGGTFYQQQTYELISPLEIISEKSEALERAFAEWRCVKAIVMSWYRKRRIADADADAKTHPRNAA
jgi:hypothetical protein